MPARNYRKGTLRRKNTTRPSRGGGPTLRASNPRLNRKPTGAPRRGPSISPLTFPMQQGSLIHAVGSRIKEVTGSRKRR